MYVVEVGGAGWWWRWLVEIGGRGGGGRWWRFLVESVEVVEVFGGGGGGFLVELVEVG